MNDVKDIDPMALKPGQELDLSQIDPSLMQMRLHAEWMMGADMEGYEVDLSAFLLDSQGQTRKDSDFIFYNNLQSQSLVVKHGGDSSAHNGQSEYIDFDLSQLSYEVVEIQLSLSLHDGDAKDQSLDRLMQLSWRISNQATAQTLTAGQLAGGEMQGTAVVFMKMVRSGTHWSVIPAAGGVDGGLGAIASPLGLLIAGQ